MSETKRAAGTGGSVVVERCQVCDSPDLESVLFLGYLPPVNQMRPVGQRPHEQPAYPAELLRCRQCQLVQIKTLKFFTKTHYLTYWLQTQVRTIRTRLKC